MQARLRGRLPGYTCTDTHHTQMRTHAHANPVQQGRTWERPSRGKKKVMRQAEGVWDSAAEYRSVRHIQPGPAKKLREGRMPLILALAVQKSAMGAAWR